MIGVIGNRNAVNEKVSTTGDEEFEVSITQILRVNQEFNSANIIESKDIQDYLWDYIQAVKVLLKENIENT